MFLYQTKLQWNRDAIGALHQVMLRDAHLVMSYGIVGADVRYTLFHNVIFHVSYFLKSYMFLVDDFIVGYIRNPIGSCIVLNVSCLPI